MTLRHNSHMSDRSANLINPKALKYLTLGDCVLVLSIGRNVKVCAGYVSQREHDLLVRHRS